MCTAAALVAVNALVAAHIFYSFGTHSAFTHRRDDRVRAAAVQVSPAANGAPPATAAASESRRKRRRGAHHYAEQHARACAPVHRAVQGWQKEAGGCDGLGAFCHVSAVGRQPDERRARVSTPERCLHSPSYRCCVRPSRLTPRFRAFRLCAYVRRHPLELTIALLVEMHRTKDALKLLGGLLGRITGPRQQVPGIKIDLDVSLVTDPLALTGVSRHSALSPTAALPYALSPPSAASLLCNRPPACEARAQQGGAHPEAAPSLQRPSRSSHMGAAQVHGRGARDGACFAEQSSRCLSWQPWDGDVRGVSPPARGANSPRGANSRLAVHTACRRAASAKVYFGCRARPFHAHSPDHRSHVQATIRRAGLRCDQSPGAAAGMRSPGMQRTCVIALSLPFSGLLLVSALRR